MFCLGMYVVALFFSIFICSAVFFAMNGRASANKGVAIEKAAANSGKETMASVAR
jgi:hypothetical protein